LSHGTVTTTKFEAGDGRTNYTTDHVRRRRDAALAGIARSSTPSSFLPLFGTRSTFQDTILRVSDVNPVRASDRHHQTRPIASWCSSNWPRSGSKPMFLLEPMRRDSGPAICGRRRLLRRHADKRRNRSGAPPPITSCAINRGFCRGPVAGGLGSGPRQDTS